MIIAIIVYFGAAMLYTIFLSYMVFIPQWGEDIGYLVTVVAAVVSSMIAGYLSFHPLLDNQPGL